MDIQKIETLVNEICAEIKDYSLERYFTDMFQTLFKVLKEETESADLHVMNFALKELRYGFKVFERYKNFPKVSIFGSARISNKTPEYQIARELGARLAQKGNMVITGAGPGVMQAGHEGAGIENSIGLNIHLPFEQEANPIIGKDPKLITFHYFFTRKLFFLKETNAAIYLPGGFGTMDEAFEVLTLIQTGKQSPLPIIFLDKPKGHFWKNWQKFIEGQLLNSGYISPEDFNLYLITDNLEDAVRYIDDFYKNYHSARYVKDEMVIRLKKPLDEAKLDEINRQFDRILLEGKWSQGQILPEEQNSFPGLPRLIGKFNRKDIGLLHQLIFKLG
jgi:uncharacterized protein (TIGR00730 family)